MKLYTEEVLLNTVNAIQIYIDKFGIEGAQPTIKNHLKMLAPIELPSDEEIETKAESFYPISKEYKEKYKTDYDDFNTCWQEGAKWMKEQILNQNK